MLEYESKEIFKKSDLPVLNGVIVFRHDDLTSKLEDIAFPAVIKSQIAIGSRKKAGLIKIAQTRQEGMELCDYYFSKESSGYKVEAILIEEVTDIQKEYYCSISLDASERHFYLLASTQGGINIEEVALESPELILKRNFNLTNGLTENMAKEVAKELGLKNKLKDEATDIFLKMWKIALENEAILIEINPLALTPLGLIALDGKMELDENAGVRNPIIKEIQSKKYTELEKDAFHDNLFFIELDGDVGILGNGAGLTLELVDVLSEMGIKPANFLDIGGGAGSDQVFKALKLICKLSPKAILINIYGGITRCDFIAEGIIKAIKYIENSPPLVIRLMGNNHLEGIQKLETEGINAFKDLSKAVEKIKVLTGD